MQKFSATVKLLDVKIDNREKIPTGWPQKKKLLRDKHGFLSSNYRVQLLFCMHLPWAKRCVLAD